MPVRPGWGHHLSHLAKVRVAGSNPVVRSKRSPPDQGHGIGMSPLVVGLPITCPSFAHHVHLRCLAGAWRKGVDDGRVDASRGREHGSCGCTSASIPTRGDVGMPPGPCTAPVGPRPRRWPSWSRPPPTAGCGRAPSASSLNAGWLPRPGLVGVDGARDPQPDALPSPPAPRTRPGDQADRRRHRRRYSLLLRRGGRDDRPLSPETVHRVHVVLHRALTQAVRWEWIWSNPAALASPPRVEPAEIRPPSVEQVRRLLDVVGRRHRLLHLPPPGRDDRRSAQPAPGHALVRRRLRPRRPSASPGLWWKGRPGRCCDRPRTGAPTGWRWTRRPLTCSSPTARAPCPTGGVADGFVFLR